MNYQNHVIDPTFFYDAIEEFAFNYNLYYIKDKTINEYGESKFSYQHEKIRGSLQSQGTSLSQSKSGNTYEKKYEFYCKSLYRINIGDIIEYKDNYLRVNSVDDYDEWGVRSCKLTMIQLTTHKDLAEYIKYLKGEKLV